MRIRYVLLPLAALAVACGGDAGKGTPSQAPAPPAAAAPAGGTTAAASVATPPGGRTVSDEQARAVMDMLVTETGPVKKVWFTIMPGDAESAALKERFETIFEQAGWEASTSTVTGMMLKPGIMILIAEEEAPPYVDTAVKAMGVSGMEVKSASGYRPYYEEMKQKNPSWPGIGLAAGQDYTIVIGPREKPAS
ncbi:MAG: hypothetical protein KIT14_13370 [bacterium]|nr:hypothetical protein [bacterium]